MVKMNPTSIVLVPLVYQDGSRDENPMSSGPLFSYYRKFVNLVLRGVSVCSELEGTRPLGWKQRRGVP